MRIFNSIILSAMLIVFIHAQPVLDWTRQHGGLPKDEGVTDVCQDNDGNIYTIGSKNSPGLAIIVKYSPEGNEIWSIENEVVSDAKIIVTDDSRNVYLLGHNYTLCKYTPEGTEVFCTDLSDLVSPGDLAHSMTVDSQEQIYIIGISTTAGSESDYCTIKCDPQGETLWRTTYDGPISSWDEPIDLAVDFDGNIYVTGSSTGNDTDSDFATIKYDSQGIQQWVARYDGPGDDGHDNASDLEVDLNGNVYITGSSAPVNPWTRDYATIKYNSDGIEQWVSRYEGAEYSRAKALALTNDGSVYVTGTGVGIETVKYDVNGNELWVDSYHQPIPELPRSELASDISIDSAGYVYVSGIVEEYQLSHHPVSIKYSSDGEAIWTIEHESLLVEHLQIAKTVVHTAGDFTIAATIRDLAGSYCFSTSRFSAEGDSLWQCLYGNSIEGLSQLEAFDMCIDESGNIYSAGIEHDSSDQGIYYVMKYNSTGNQEWLVQTSVTLAGDEPWIKLSLGLDGHIYTIKTVYDDMSVLTKMSTDGEILWDSPIEEGCFHPTDIKVDAGGYIYLTSIENCVTIDLITAKHNPDGSENWRVIHSYGLEDNSPHGNAFLTVDSSGNIYVVSESSYSVYTLLLKYGPDGSQLFEAAPIGPDGSQLTFPCFIEIDSHGDVIVISQAHADGPLQTNIISKFTSDGSLIWEYTIDFQFWDVTDAAMDNMGNIYVTGSGDQQTATAKIDSSGNLLWHNYSVLWGGLEDDSAGPAFMALDSFGDVYVVSGGSGGMSFIKAIKYSTTGNLVWNKIYSTYGAINATNIEVSALGAVVITGNEYFMANAPYDWSVSHTVSYSQADPLGFAIIREYPESVKLHNNFPNPFNPSTTISYELPEQSRVNLTVFDIRGKEVMTLEQSDKPPGNYEVQWNGLGQAGKQVSTGVYFCRLNAGTYNQTIKMVYLK